MSGMNVSPRQRMINLMYLVLTAMLALNVSAEILRAFFLMEKSIEQTGVNVDSKNADIMLAFQHHMETQPDLTREHYQKAREAKQVSETFIQEVENLKNLLIQETGGRELNEDGEETELVGRDNIEVHARLLINEGRGQRLRENINATRKKLLNLLDSQSRKDVLSDLHAEHKGPQSWESFHFEQSPLAAVIPMLSKIQNDAKNTTYDVLYKLFQNINGNPIPVDRVQAEIVPRSNYVMQGDKFEAEVYLTAYSSKQAHEVYIDGKKLEPQNGKVVYQLPASSTGKHEVSGEIWVREADSLRKYPFKTEYNVFKGAANISADNMKQLFVNAPNPMTIAVPGVTADKVRASISPGQLERKGPNSYNAVVRANGKVVVTVEAKDDFGNWTTVSREEFRARPIPSTDIRLGVLQPDKSYTTGAIKVQNIMVATPGDLIIKDFSLKIESFDLMIYQKNRPAIGPFHNTGRAISPQIKSAISGLRPGSTLVFSNIKIDKMPDKVYSYTIRTR